MPFACARFPGGAVRRTCRASGSKRDTTSQQYTEMPRGGHFAALEEPDCWWTMSGSFSAGAAERSASAEREVLEPAGAVADPIDVGTPILSSSVRCRLASGVPLGILQVPAARLAPDAAADEQDRQIGRWRAGWSRPCRRRRRSSCDRAASRRRPASACSLSR